MNKTLILALAIAITSFGCADEESADVNDPGQTILSTTQDQVTVAATDVEDIADSASDAINSTTDAIEKNVTNNKDLVDFTSLDANADGVISETEAQSTANLKSAFTELDIDHNGSLSKEEYQKLAMLAL